MFEGSDVVLPDAFAVEPSTVGTVILYECSLDILGFFCNGLLLALASLAKGQPEVGFVADVPLLAESLQHCRRDEAGPEGL